MSVFDTVKEKLTHFSDMDSAIISIDTNLVETLGLDSFAAICLLGELSEEYGIDFKAEDLADFVNVGDVVYLIEEVLKRNG